MRHYVSTSQEGINRNSLPFKLYEKAKKFGIWNPNDIDFSQDKANWESLNVDQQDALLQLISFFYSGEEAVTNDILPLIYAISKTGQFEEEMYLTQFFIRGSETCRLF